MKQRLREWLTGLVGFALMILLLASLIVPTQGPSYCESAFHDKYAALAETGSITTRMWTRTQASHWVAALVVQPQDISRQPITVVCHFRTTNYVIDRVEIFDGNRLHALKDVSRSNLDPRTWFQ